MNLKKLWSNPLSGKVRIVADLNYCGFSQAFLDPLMGNEAPKAHIIKMNNTTATMRGTPLLI